jgi:hypothetical protein
MPPSFSLARALLADDGTQLMRLGLMSRGKWASRRWTRRDEVAVKKFGKLPGNIERVPNVS